MGSCRSLTNGAISSIIVFFDIALGFVAKKGQIIDATIVRVPTQRNTRDENKAIKEGNPPVEKRRI